jgi:hypothetical protein
VGYTANISKEFATSILSASDSVPENKICTVSTLIHKLHMNHATLRVLTKVMLKIQVIWRVISDVAKIIVSSCACISSNPRVFTYLLTYLITPRSGVLLEKLASSQLAKKLPTFYGTRRFITAFTSARHLPLS